MNGSGWNGIRAGDIGFDRGGGIVGWLIRLGSKSTHAHCWVFVFEVSPGVWLTHEAYPGGLRRRTRTVGDESLVVRVWRTGEERRRLLSCSSSLVGARYAYQEIVRIVLARVWSLVTFGKGSFPTPRQVTHPGSVICSNHCARAAMAARPELQLTYPVGAIWPGKLANDLQRQQWNDQH